tara:strand:- start:304 stop:606 length:303 start_codon:yes stop_codon:yes gene_type:complete
MSKLLPLQACTEFSSLLLSKPLVLLDIPRLKKVLELCGKSRTCCASAKEALRAAAEKEIYDLVRSLNEEEVDRLREDFVDKKNNSGLNIIFEKISKNLII